MDCNLILFFINHFHTIYFRKCKSGKKNLLKLFLNLNKVIGLLTSHGGMDGEC